MTARTRLILVALLGSAAAPVGCAGLQTPMPPNAGIHRPLAVAPPAAVPPPEALPDPPVYVPAAAGAKVPDGPKAKHALPADPAALVPAQGPPPAAGPLDLAAVLADVSRAFPLLYAVEQERAAAGGQRLAAEGAYDLTLRGRGSNQEGTFENSRLDVSAEQRTTAWGTTVFAGYRLGGGNFPIYNGDRKTADGGEFRAGVLVPLLRDGPIDRQRAALRQAQIQESLADPTVRRARLDFLLSAARGYWAWVAAGERHAVAAALLQLANDRQAGFDERFKAGAEAEFVVVQNRLLIATRRGDEVSARRRLEQAAFDLSLFLRDAAGNPVVPPAARLPRGFAAAPPPPPADPAGLAADVQFALANRPELDRFRLLKDRAAVDLQLAANQLYPNISAGVTASQDVGKARKTFTGTGPFETDRTTAEVFLVGDVPVQRREALGRSREATARLAQLAAQERFERDRVSAQVQDAVSNLDRTLQRLTAAREEAAAAQKVAAMERERFREGASDLLAVNLQEIAAAAAVAKVIDTLAESFRAVAEYDAARGRDPR